MTLDEFVVKVQDTKEIEIGLLGCLMQNVGFWNYLEDLEEDDFQYESTASCFRALKEMHHEKIEANRYTIKQKWLSQGEEAQNIIATASVIAPTTAGFESYLRLVKEASIRRKVIKESFELCKMAENGENISDIYAKAAACAKVSEIGDGQEAVSFSDGYEKYIARRESPREYIVTGYEGLDRFLKISRGDYIVLGGRPSSGKTAFSLELALRFSRKHKVIYFSLETSSEKLMDRLITASAGVNFSKLQSGTLEDFEIKKTDDLKAKAKEYDLHIVEASGRTVDWMTMKAMKMEAEIVFVDYLGLVKSDGKTPYERTTLVSTQLHTMAQQRKILVVALSQLSRSGDTRTPTLTDLRESGQIEQDADAVILLQKGEEITEYSGRPTGKYREKVIVAKNKTGYTGEKDYLFIGYMQRFEESNEEI